MLLRCIMLGLSSNRRALLCFNPEESNIWNADVWYAGTFDGELIFVLTAWSLRFQPSSQTGVRRRCDPICQLLMMPIFQSSDTYSLCQDVMLSIHAFLSFHFLFFLALGTNPYLRFFSKQSPYLIK